MILFAMPKKIDNNQVARILIDSVMIGDHAAVQKYNISLRTLQRYRLRLEGDFRLKDAMTLQEKLVSRDFAKSFDLSHKNQMTLAQESAKAAIARASSDAGFKNESDLEKAVCNNLSKLCRVIGLPKPLKFEAEYRIEGKRIDLLISHHKNIFTICEIKSCGQKRSHRSGWLLYPAIGQLLYYFEMFKDLYGISSQKINLLILGDYDPDIYFFMALNNVIPTIRYLNVAEVICGKP